MPYFLQTRSRIDVEWGLLDSEAEQIYWPIGGTPGAIDDYDRPSFGPFLRRRDAQVIAEAHDYIPELKGRSVEVVFLPDEWEQAALDEIPRPGELLTNLLSTPVRTMEELAERDVQTALLVGMGIGSPDYKFRDRPYILFEKPVGASSGERVLVQMAAEIYESLWSNDYHFVYDVIDRFSRPVKDRVRPVLANLV